jgi:serine/threonine-protein kinase CHEK2
VDLIDSMLVVDPAKRYTIDQCLSHPWMTAGIPGVNDSTDGLVGGLAGLEVNRRGMRRERTLLSTINSVEVTKIAGGKNHEAIKVFSKNSKAAKETRPADSQHPEVFAEFGGKGDPTLFGNETSNYPTKDVAASKKGKAKGGKSGR